MSRRGENIRKRKDGRWEGRYIKGYDSKKQKARYASVYGKTYAETKQKLDEAKYKSSIGVVYVDAKNKLFGEIINSWFNAKKINLKPSSIIKYQNLIEKHILPELGHRKLRELNADLFYTFLDAQQKNGNKKNGGMLSTSSLQTMLYILNATIKYAASNNMVAYFSICLTRSGKEATPIQTLEQHEEDALDLFLSTHISRRNLGIMLSLYCGLRIGEVCALQWTDIDTKNAILYVRRTVQRIAHSSGKTKTKIHVGSPKSKSSIRVIPIPSFLVPIICTLAQEDPPDAYILTGSINKPLEPRTFQYYFDQVLTMAGIQKTNYHTLRHTFATNCVISLYRVCGIHFILATQTMSRLRNGFTVSPSTLSEMHVRIGLKCSESECNLLFGGTNAKAAFDKMGDTNITDIISALTMNHPTVVNRFNDEDVAYYRHKDGYWNRRNENGTNAGMREKDSFANVFAIETGNYRISTNFVERWFPELSIALRQSVEGA